MNSIRSQLLFWQTSALIIAVGFASLLTYITVWHSFNVLLDHELQQIAVSIMRHGSEEHGFSSDLPLEDEASDVLSQIWNTPVARVYSSLPEEKLPYTRPGFSDLSWNGHHWRIYAVEYDGYTIQTAHRLREREAIFSRTMMWALLTPGLALVVGLGSLLWYVVYRALMPLNDLREAISARSPTDLTAISTEQVPSEISALVDTLNHLFKRVSDMLCVQRRFIADAAHELRTPLTAVKLQAQLASRAENMQQCNASLENLQAGISRAAHLIDQLLQMAKLDPDAQLSAPHPIQLDEMLKQTVANSSILAADKSIDLGVTQCDSIKLMGHSQAIQALIRNLIDNAIRYTPRGGVIDVSLHESSGEVLLQVADSGPGIPESERERVFERFHRIGGDDVQGSGLGLSIVAEVATMHNARIILGDAELGGLLVTVLFHPMEADK